MIPWHGAQNFGNDYMRASPAGPGGAQNAEGPNVQQFGNPNQILPQPPLPPQQSLSSVLHFLQSEHRRYARDRNEWEIERAEMRARIALLEGEKRGNEGIVRDLSRRCKMLENALRGERSKTMNHPNSISSVSGTSSPIPSAAPKGQPSLLREALTHAITSDPGSVENTPNSSTHANANSEKPVPSRTNSSLGLNGTANRDPRAVRGRVKGTRDYLKACLQEITYLTSSTTLNPLAATSYSAPNVPRPRKVLPDYVPPTTNNNSTPGLINMAALTNALGSNSESQTSSIPSIHTNSGTSNAGSSSPTVPYVPLKALDAVNTVLPESPEVETDAFMPSAEGESKKADESTTLHEFVGTAPGTDSTGNDDKDFSSLDRGSESNDDGDVVVTIPNQKKQSEEQEEKNVTLDLGVRLREPKDGANWMNGKKASWDSSRITAIFKPESDEDWKERLRAAGEGLESGISRGGQSGEPDLDNLDWDYDEDGEDGDGKAERKGKQNGETDASLWKTQVTLRSHLDGVRCVSFSDDGRWLVSGGDDYAVKLWRVESPDSGPKRFIVLPEPVKTYREHTSSVTCLAVSSATNKIFSGSLDNTINVWEITPQSQEPYDAFDETLHQGSLIGHNNAIWGLQFVDDEDLVLSSISSDGTVKLWDTTAATSQEALKISWEYGGVGAERRRKTIIPTSHCIARGCGDESLKVIAVAFQNSVVKLYDSETGKETGRLPSDSSYDGTVGTQINKVLAHPHLPILVTCHEDKFIRIFDLTFNTLVHEFVAHLDGITSLAFVLNSPSTPPDASNPIHTLVSVSHDDSIRFWDFTMASSAPPVCIQEIAAHRSKTSSEGILGVTVHPEATLLATSGADSTVKLWVKT